jgi:hypothetical protein
VGDIEAESGLRKRLEEGIELGDCTAASCLFSFVSPNRGSPAERCASRTTNSLNFFLLYPMLSTQADYA